MRLYFSSCALSSASAVFNANLSSPHPHRHTGSGKKAIFIFIFTLDSVCMNLHIPNFVSQKFLTFLFHLFILYINTNLPLYEKRHYKIIKLMYKSEF